MAHFAKIENDVVTNVLVIDNEHEAYGQAYLNGLGLSGTWIQTSYNANIRGKFAGIGDVYNKSKDRFEPAKPYASWTWDESSYSYLAPTPYPSDGNPYNWNEATKSWDLVVIPE